MKGKVLQNIIKSEVTAKLSLWAFAVFIFLYVHLNPEEQHSVLAC